MTESAPIGTAAGSTAIAATISLTGSALRSESAPASFTGGAGRVGSGFMGMAGAMGLVALVL